MRILFIDDQKILDMNHKTDKDTAKFRSFIDKCAKEVESWPDWMKGKPDPVVCRIHSCYNHICGCREKRRTRRP